ncbi:uncharacterized protein BCR38DRAFT_339676 [Pseudomassariella vexata]|uniref:C2H2-type domain-containing protein n=1 Tax=Pseudomassariella vexata TaxID=1141098 RepID=A0A1Y2E3J8_9PEZI|nr:uncharacterized protein BCR38DRAFT_339676 [Pseudomassariella vexata]ORY65934.1 hypothetical protein BCR38DRAFT_339676 [Pseudomassariella vexata]
MSNPRRTPVTGRSEGTTGLSLKTNFTLRKGATFHSPTTPPSSPPQAAGFRVPSLPRRSQTTLDDVVDASRRRMELTLQPILNATKAETSSSRPFRDNSLPVPQSFLEQVVMNDNMTQEPPVMDTTERRVLRQRPTRSSRHHDSDSGLGTSIASKASRASKSSGAAAGITRSAAVTGSENTPRRLSQRAVNRIHEHTLKPLLAKPSLNEFHPIVLDCPRRIQENQIVCLRDLEKTLIFMAPVSELLKDDCVWGDTYRMLCLKERAKSAELYLDFCLTSIRCIQATVEYLSDREQTRPHDRPYTQGYFIDLVEQIRQHAQQIQASRERQAAGEEPGEMDVDPTDEVKLMGGLSSTGRPAELVRVKKNGKAISIATGQVVESLEEDTSVPVRFKRSMSEQLEDEEEIVRSMARRKKNASPEELAPKKCKEPGCNKEFKRPCDLTKHEKTHSRPWKCPISTCKYHDYGWPTEKEMDRHVNDKHSAAPPMFECLYKPCPYKSKRDSNRKQHMEKAHGWTYVRTKTNKSSGKLPTTAESTTGSSTKPTPMIPNMPTPNSNDQNSNDQNSNHVMMTPPEETPFTYEYENNLDFPAYVPADPFNPGLFDPTSLGDIQLDLDYSPVDNGTPSTDAEHQFNAYQDLSDVSGQFEEDIYGAHVQLPLTHMQLSPANSDYSKCPAPVFTDFATSNVCQASCASHISPVGQGNTMLFTPSSMADVDEGFDEFPANEPLGNDFLLFPPDMGNKPSEFENPLFVTPSAAAGFTQPSSQDFNMDFNQAMDWTSDYNTYQHQP